MPDIVQTIEADAVALLHQAHIASGQPSIAIDDSGWCAGDGVTVVRKMPVDAPGVVTETPKQQSLAPGLDHVEGIVTHWTDTRGCGAVNLAKRLLDPSNTRAASWHVCIDAAGAIVQSVSAKCGSWHAGGDGAALFMRSADGKWTPLTKAQRGQIRGYSANSWAFGIELECVGDVRFVNGEWLGWPFARGTQYGTPAVVPAAEVQADATAPSRGWQMFTGPQLDSLGRVIGALVGRYGLRRDACSWRHCQIDPENRTDPGPLMLGFPVPSVGASPNGALSGILDRVFGT